MGERDAFGREKEEDALAGLGWGEREPSTTQGGGQPPATQLTTAGAPPRRRRGSGLGVGTLAVLLLVVAIGAAATVLTTGKTDDTKPAPSAAVTPGKTKQQPANEQPATEAPPATPPKGVDHGSLVLRTNFGAAMRRLSTSGRGRLHSLRVAPDRIDVQLLTKTGRLRMIQIRPGGGVRELNTTGTGFSHLQTIPFAAVNSAGPFRMVSAAAKRLGRNARSVDYLVLTDFAGRRIWSVFFKDGKHFIGDVSGRLERQIS